MSKYPPSHANERWNQVLVPLKAPRIIPALASRNSRSETGRLQPKTPLSAFLKKRTDGAADDLASRFYDCSVTGPPTMWMMGRKETLAIEDETDVWDHGSPRLRLRCTGDPLVTFV